MIKIALSKKWLVRMQASDLARSSQKIFAKNMTALKNKDANLHQRISDLPPDPSYELIQQKTKDLYNLILPTEQGRQAYYDTEDILDSVEKTLNHSNTKNRQLIIHCGIGLGYELLTFINHYTQHNLTQTILIIEKDPQIFKRCLEVTDLSQVLSNPHITFMIGLAVPDFSAAFINYIAPYERVIQLKAMCVLVSEPCLRLSAAYYTQIIQAVKSGSIYIIQLFGNSPEDSLVGERHMFRNIQHILENPGLNLLYGKFIGKPAIVCASGPSLTAELPLLKTLQDQVLILSAESTFWALTAHGIHPHIMCTLEREVRPTGYFDQFTYDDVKDTYLAAVPVIPPKMYETYLGPKINVYRNFNHFHWLPFDKGTLDIKKSSANMAFKLAHMLGCSPIILLGQDLCFDRETHLTHVKEHHHGAEQTFFQKQKHVEVPANDGQTAQTSETWMEFLQGYIIDVREYGGDVINCSAQGVSIQGTRYLPFRQVVEEHLQEPCNPAPLIKEALASFTTTAIQTDLDLLRDKINTALADLAHMVEACVESVRYIGAIAENYQDFLENLDIPVQEHHALQAAQKKIEELKISLMNSDTFQKLVLHVVQSYMIAFAMNLNQDYLILKNDESLMLHTIIKHREYFAFLGAMIDMIRVEVENARETAAAIQGSDISQNYQNIDQDIGPDSNPLLDSIPCNLPLSEPKSPETEARP